MTIEYLPTLAKGAHSKYDGHACVMEYVSVLAGEEFTDAPACTHPWIAGVARVLNDGAYDHDRGLLIPLIPRLLEATPSVDARERARVNRELAKWIKSDKDLFPSIFLSMLPEAATGALAQQQVMQYRTASAQIGYLTRLLDEYDRIVGKTKAPALEPARLTKAVMEVEGLPKPPQDDYTPGGFKVGVKKIVAKIDWNKFAFGASGVTAAQPVSAINGKVETEVAYDTVRYMTKKDVTV